VNIDLEKLREMRIVAEAYPYEIIVHRKAKFFSQQVLELLPMADKTMKLEQAAKELLADRFFKCHCVGAAHDYTLEYCSFCKLEQTVKELK